MSEALQNMLLMLAFKVVFGATYLMMGLVSGVNFLFSPVTWYVLPVPTIYLMEVLIVLFWPVWNIVGVLLWIDIVYFGG